MFFFCVVWHMHARTHTHTWQAGVENTRQCVEGCVFCWLLAVQLSYVKAPKKVCYRNNKLKYITEYLLVKRTYYICMCTRLPDTQYCVAGCGHVAVQLSYCWIKLYCSKVCYSYCHFLSRQMTGYALVRHCPTAYYIAWPITNCTQGMC